MIIFKNKLEIKKIPPNNKAFSLWTLLSFGQSISFNFEQILSLKINKKKVLKKRKNYISKIAYYFFNKFFCKKI